MRFYCICVFWRLGRMCDQKMPPVMYGRADMVLMTGGQVFVFEFKMVEHAAKTEAGFATTFAQMRDQGYADTYHDQAEPVHLVAVFCGRDTLNLLDIQIEHGG